MARLEGTNFDHYHLLSLIGQGGMSEVYLAQDEQSGEQVAVKVVSGSNAVYLERFRREAEAVDKLRHPHILPALDYGDQEPWHYLVMPYIAGGTLRERLQGGPLEPRYADNLLQQIAGALQFAHEHALIHRDIKPSNILIDREQPHIYLADFGLVKNLEGAEQLTQSGTLLGTPEYMAPDLADGPASESSDIYALGVLLYYMVSGFLPFTGDTPIAVYWKHIRDQALPPSLLHPKLSPAIDTVLMRALEKDRTKRYQSALELAQAFHQAVYAPEESMQEAKETPVEVEEVVEQAESMPEVLQRRGRRERPSSPHRLRRAEALRGKNTPRLTAFLPSRPLPRQTTPEALPFPPLKTVRSRRQRNRHLARLTLGVLLIGLFLFLILPMGYIYYIYNTQHTTVMAEATATVNAQTTAQTQATGTANILLNAVSGTPLLDDPLVANTENRWQEDASTCTFTGVSYQVQPGQGNGQQSCALNAPQVGDGTVQVDVALVNSANAGLLLRVNGGQYDDFEITSQGQYFFRRHTNSQNIVNLLPPKSSSVILQGLQHNTLTVIARKSDFQLFINGTFVGEAHDSSGESGSEGNIALVAGAQSGSAGGSASFTNFKIFPLS